VKFREPRNATTDSEEELLEKSKAAKTKKIRQKPTTIAKKGHSLDKFFPTMVLRTQYSPFSDKLPPYFSKQRASPYNRTTLDHKDNFLFIIGMHHYLIIPRKCIHEAEIRETRC
jgi:hypothetical protein